MYLIFEIIERISPTVDDGTETKSTSQIDQDEFH